MIKKIMSVIVLLGYCGVANAYENIVYRMGFGLSNTKDSALYSLGYERNFKHSIFQYKFDVGAWTTTRPGRASSPYGAFLLGPKFGDDTGFNLRTMAGISIIGLTDEMLGSNFQFTEEAIISYQTVGIGYKHVSNAGIVKPNLGRDYLYIHFTFPLGY